VGYKDKVKEKLNRVQYMSTEHGWLTVKYNDLKKTWKRKPHRKEFKDVLTKEEFLQSWKEHKEKHGWNCYYTGELMTIGRPLSENGIHNRNSADPNKMSIDRFDSTKGYTKDNIVFCCWFFNNRKGPVTLDDCKIILQKALDRKTT
jgi:hypothetical protein